MPFHLGVRGVGMGGGPLELLREGGVPNRLRAEGFDVEVVWIAEPGDEHEVGRVFEINRGLAEAVRAAHASDRHPLILAGNCNVCLGAIGGITEPRTGIVWLDAHADFHTPETTDSGFLDGMGLAMATGGCWRTLARSIPGFHPVEEQNTILVGARDIDRTERERLDSGPTAVIEGGNGPGTLPGAVFRRALDAVASRVAGVYLHFDFDCLDPSLGRANEYAAPGGLGIDDVRQVIATVARRVPILATSVTAYNPGIDHDRFGTTAMEAIQVLAATIYSPGSG